MTAPGRCSSTPCFGAVLALSLGDAEEPRAYTPLVHIAELEIDPSRLDAFKEAVKEELETSASVEPGVLAIYAVTAKENPSKLRFFEMSTDEAAFQARIGSPHFRKYRATTQDMILSRKLIETVPVQLIDKKEY